jgi:crossover junction endonuclease MUS81
MIIKIDTREQELFNKCESTIDAVPKFKGIKLMYETLPLGDIIINDGINDCIIIERKTLTDLASSIKDGRYDEQSYRLNGLSHHNHNIIYLIEGDMFRFNTFKERIDKQTLYSAMFSIHYFKGFSVMRSNNMDETAMIVCNMIYKLVSGLNSGKHGFYSNIVNINSQNITSNCVDVDTSNDTNVNNNMVTEKDYCSVIKKIKKDNITPENIGEIMLCQIPGISSTSALAILTQFKTLPNLIKSIKENDTCLNNICTTDTNGKSRKISKTAIATLVKFLKE